MKKTGTYLLLLSLSMLLSSMSCAVEPRQLSLEMLYHPQKKENFTIAPLTGLNWDGQNRLVESRSKDGVVTSLLINPLNWEKQAAYSDAPVRKWLRAAGIDAAEALTIAEQLAPKITPAVNRYLFVSKQDLWLVDLAAAAVRRLTYSPEQSKDEALLSPDGQAVAYLKGNDLYLSDVASAKETRLTSGGSASNLNGRHDWVYMEEIYGRGTMRAFWWSPDSQRLAFLNFDESRVPLYTLSADHRNPSTSVATRYPQAGDPNPVVRLGVVDLTGQVSWSANPYGSAETLIVQVGWTPDGRLLASWQDRAQTWLDLRLYQPSLGDSEVMVRETSPAWTGRLPLPHFLQDGGFIWESERSGHMHLYRYDKNFRLRAALTSGNWDVRSVEGIDQVRGRILLTANERNLIGRDVYALALEGGPLQRLSEAKGTHLARWNHDYTQFIDSWSSLTQPPAQALVRADGVQIKLVDAAGVPAALQAVRRAGVLHQRIPARDGTLLESLLYLPPDFDAHKKYPVYQHLYAGPMTPMVVDRWSNDLYYHFLAEQGYVVWILDNRSASNQGPVSAWPIYQRLGELELQDQLDGLAWLAQQGWADMDRIALNGWSYGGYFTAYAMTHSKAWKIGMVGAPVTDWRLYDSVYTERYMGLPSENQAGYERSSVLQAAAQLHGKILIMHGTMDDNVHPQNSIMFIDALIKQGQDYSLQLYPGQEHGPRGDAVIWSLQKAKWEFLKNNL
ncbi:MULTISPECIES: S9 family peptidase [unclassified Undibacterium]|uniref:S9 family peptidase n=3 Tax=Pseudomonadota TaxID=1224 RepID=UPI002AC97D9E|nr:MULTISPECIES: DPP IV N-terminal domain-containing protein [unclassified Undibacterium]MEB0215755.1 DPP IV N-terminal domain-containing protein [Undibacterium sp. 5I2]WPX45176.1 DPP IV N-terminal domain-containing protein [Undibacterium sp. CCC3.4]